MLLCYLDFVLYIVRCMNLLGIVRFVRLCYFLDNFENVCYGMFRNMFNNIILCMFVSFTSSK